MATEGEAMGGAALVGNRVWVYHTDQVQTVHHVNYGTWMKAEISGFDEKSGEHTVSSRRGRE